MLRRELFSGALRLEIASGRTKYPLLCFSDSFFDIDTDIDLSQTVFPNKTVELDARVHDEAKWFFEDVHEDLAALATGDIGTETADTDPEQADSDSVIRQPCSPRGGSGYCFCIRKGSSDSAGCPRCQGDGNVDNSAFRRTSTLCGLH